MIVYADLVFLLNLLIDAAVLQATAWCRRLRPPWWRLWLGAVLGALYAMVVLVPELSALYSFPFKVLFSLAMIFAVFGFRSLQFFLGNAAVFYLINFAAAGGVFALHYMLQSSGEVLDSILFTSGGAAFRVEIGTAFIIIASIAAVFYFRKVWSFMKQREAKARFKAEVAVRIEGETVTCAGLIDTGNQLYDPLTRTPVMVMEVRCWERLIGGTWLNLIEREDMEAVIEALEREHVPWHNRLRLVPYHGIQKGTQFMLALKPDEVKITVDGKEIRAEKVLVGLKGGTLSREGAYRAIVHPALLETLEEPARAEPLAGTL